MFSGEGEVLFGHQTHRISDNEAVHVDCQVLHGIRNVGLSLLPFLDKRDGLCYAVIIAK